MTSNSLYNSERSGTFLSMTINDFYDDSVADLRRFPDRIIYESATPRLTFNHIYEPTRGPTCSAPEDAVVYDHAL